MWHVDSLYTKKNLIEKYLFCSEQLAISSCYMSSTNARVSSIFVYIETVEWLLFDCQENIPKWNQALKYYHRLSMNRCYSSNLNKSFLLTLSCEIRKSFLLRCLSILSILFNITNWSLYIFVFFCPTDIILICHSLWCRHHSNK
jgi:hypothetical protein